MPNSNQARDEYLRGCIDRARRHPEGSFIPGVSDEVIHRFGAAFHPDNLDHLTAADMGDFMSYRHNRHWKGLDRNKTKVTADMPRLRAGLAVLLDEDAPLASRWDTALGMVRGMGRAVASPILLVVHPDRYGVWNTVSEDMMTSLSYLPEATRPRQDGRTYAHVNDILLGISDRLGVDLWHLDTLWRFVSFDRGGGSTTTPSS